MDVQPDMFASEILAPAERAEDAALPQPLAAPCGFRIRRGAPCLRLAHRPLLCEGRQLRSDGRPLLHCEPDCFDGIDAEMNGKAQ